jgi:hypothetical protein
LWFFPLGRVYFLFTDDEATKKDVMAKRILKKLLSDLIKFATKSLIRRFRAWQAARQLAKLSGVRSRIFHSLFWMTDPNFYTQSRSPALRAAGRPISPRRSSIASRPASAHGSLYSNRTTFLQRATRKIGFGKRTVRIEQGQLERFGSVRLPTSRL